MSLSEDWSGKVFKIALIGANQVGKTYSIYQALSQHNFTPNDYIYRKTIGDIYELSYCSNPNVLQAKDLIRIYDTGGIDESFDLISSHYGAIIDAFILIFDFLKPETFDELVKFKNRIGKTKKCQKILFHLVGIKKKSISKKELDLENHVSTKWSNNEQIEFSIIDQLRPKMLLSCINTLVEKMAVNVTIEHKKGFFKKK